ncbi:MAG: hypothetical protein AB1779_10970 [Candidatus Thermoplasmatota archaeon]
MREIQNVTNKEIQDAKKLIRENPQSYLVYSDTKRQKLLQKFVMIIEESDEMFEEEIKSWLSNFKSEVILTP